MKAQARRTLRHRNFFQGDIQFERTGRSFGCCTPIANVLYQHRIAMTAKMLRQPVLSGVREYASAHICDA